MGDLFVLPYIFICLFNNLYKYGFMDIYFHTLGYIIQNYFFFFSQLFPALAMGNSFSWFILGHFGFCLFCLPSTSLLSSTKRCLRITLFLLYPSCRISSLFKEAWFLLLAVVLETKFSVLDVLPL